MIICVDCKHGGKNEYCQSNYAIGLTLAQKRAVYSSCAFFEPDGQKAESDETKDTDEPGLFD
jgi:hypothetical protein